MESDDVSNDPITTPTNTRAPPCRNTGTPRHHTRMTHCGGWGGGGNKVGGLHCSVNIMYKWTIM